MQKYVGAKECMFCNIFHMRKMQLVRKATTVKITRLKLSRINEIFFIAAVVIVSIVPTVFFKFDSEKRMNEPQAPTRITL